MKKVLIVDDNEAVIATLRTVLVRSDYEVVEAQDGQSCLAVAGCEQPDVILLDWLLPDFEGPDLMGKLREVSTAPCIMITAQDTVHHCVAALEAGCDDFIAKPIRPDELLLRLHRLIGK